MVEEEREAAADAEISSCNRFNKSVLVYYEEAGNYLGYPLNLNLICNCFFFFLSDTYSCSFLLLMIVARLLVFLSRWELAHFPHRKWFRRILNECYLVGSL